MDKVGNRTQVIETRAAFDGSPTPVVITHTYQYDALDRLVNAATEDPASDTAYTFDAVGNRLSKTGTVLAPDPGLPELPVSPQPEAVAYTYNAANQLTRIQEPGRETALAYNGNGDRVREIVGAQNLAPLPDGTVRVTEYAYDREDRLVGVTKTMSDSAAITVTMIATYTYDGYGRRVRKEVAYPGGITATQVITYLYDGLDIIGAQLAVSGTVTETYYYLAPSPLTGLRRPFEMEIVRAQNLAPLSTGDRYWYETDGLDSIIALTDETGDLASPYLYDEYGQHLAGTTDLQLFTYTAQDYDPETGLIHFYARYYDPARGVWLTQDAWRGYTLLPQTQHRYGYALGNPTSVVERYGYYVGADDGIALVGGFLKGISVQGIGDLLDWRLSRWEEYVASGVAGSIGTEISLYASPIIGGAIEGAIEPVIRDILINRSNLSGWCWENTLRDALVEAVWGGATAGIGGKASPKVRGRIAKGLRYFISKRALRLYRELTEGLVEDVIWDRLESAFRKISEDIDLGVFNRDLCAHNNEAVGMCPYEPTNNTDYTRFMLDKCSRMCSSACNDFWKDYCGSHSDWRCEQPYVKSIVSSKKDIHNAPS